MLASLGAGSVECQDSFREGDSEHWEGEGTEWDARAN